MQAHSQPPNTAAPGAEACAATVALTWLGKARNSVIRMETFVTSHQTVRGERSVMCRGLAINPARRPAALRNAITDDRAGLPSSRSQGYRVSGPAVSLVRGAETGLVCAGPGVCRALSLVPTSFL